MVSVVDYGEAGHGLLYRSFGATGDSPSRNRLRALRRGVSFFRLTSVSQCYGEPALARTALG